MSRYRVDIKEVDAELKAEDAVFAPVTSARRA
jgi:hypothetical protein